MPPAAPWSAGWTGFVAHPARLASLTESRTARSRVRGLVACGSRLAPNTAQQFRGLSNADVAKGRDFRTEATAVNPEEPGLLRDSGKGDRRTGLANGPAAMARSGPTGGRRTMGGADTERGSDCAKDLRRRGGLGLLGGLPGVIRAVSSTIAPRLLGFVTRLQRGHGGRPRPSHTSHYREPRRARITLGLRQGRPAYRARERPPGDGDEWLVGAPTEHYPAHWPQPCARRPHVRMTR
jgi:hypothetical protein